MKLRKIVLTLACVVTLAGCNFNKILIDSPTGPSSTLTPTPTPTPVATPSPTPVAEGLGEGAYVRVGVFAYSCPAGVTAPRNGSGELPLACTAHVTATPKDKNGDDIPASQHGPSISWVVSGPVLCTAPTEPFNRDCRGLAAGTAQLRATVKGVTGTLDLTVVP